MHTALRLNLSLRLLVPMRLLLVEDDDQIADFITQGLREAGYAVDHTADGEEGYRHALNESYAAAIIDLMLPRRDGLDIIQNLRKRGVDTPVLILSAKRSTNERVEGLRAGGDDYLTKPFAFTELLARVRALIRRASGRADVGASMAHDPSGDASQNGPSTRYSGNVHIRHRALSLTAEALARTTAAPGEMETGAYVTGTYQVASAHTLRARTDWVRYSGPVPEAPTQLGIGYTYQPTSYLRIETDVVAPVEDATVQPVMLRTQVQVHF